MPLPENTRYRFQTLLSRKKIRLAFKSGTNKVIEAKSYESLFGKKRKKKNA